VRLYVLCLASLLSAGCRNGLTRRVDPPPPMPMCGDGKIDDGEECDGSNLAEQTCLTLGFEAGQLTCSPTCSFAKTLCTRRCGNGMLDQGEACDGMAGVPVCTSYGANRCGADCQLDTSNCLTQAFEAAPELTTANGGHAVIADVPPLNVPDLVMAVPSRNRVELFAWNTVQGFSGATSRKLSFQRTPLICVTGDLNADGTLDVATVNDDGAFDAYLATGSTFAPRELDGGCRFAELAGVVNVGGRRDLAVAFGCQAAFTLETAGVRRVDLPDAGALGVGDFTLDGVGDLVVVDAQGESLTVFPGPSFGRGTSLPLGVLPSKLAVGDLDGDQDADLAAIVGSDVKLYENTGVGLAEKLVFAAARASAVEIRDFDLDGVPDVFFTAGDDVVVRRNRGQWALSEFRQPVGAGTRLSVAVGDVDGDGDLDVAVTFSTGADATRTAVVRNRAR
jgi:hypothetical protein